MYPRPLLRCQIRAVKSIYSYKFCGGNQIGRSLFRMASSSSSEALPPGFEKIITEGKAKILMPTGNKAFYNNVQAVNRDLSVLVLNEYALQIQTEIDDQNIKRENHVSWRGMKPTWDTWNSSVDWEAIKKAKEEKEAADAKLTEEEKLKIAEEKNKSRIQTFDPNHKRSDLKVARSGLRILEALSASGLRSIRYAKEVVHGINVDEIICNDLEQSAVEVIKQNIEYNKIENNKIIASCDDASAVMYSNRVPVNDKRPKLIKTNGEEELPKQIGFDVIDLDPYGSPTAFIDGAVQSAEEGGLLCITATDLAALCGKNSEVCFAKYGAMPIKQPYGHEAAIRILLQSVERAANKYSRYIVPLLSVKIDFYVRVFVRIYTSKKEVKLTATKLSQVIQSRGCSAFYLQPLGRLKKDSQELVVAAEKIDVSGTCPITGSKFSLAGPIWNRPIHNMAFVRSLLKKLERRDVRHEKASKIRVEGLVYPDRVEGLLTAVQEEVLDCPLYYHLPAISKTLHCSTPSLNHFQGALINAGYKVSQCHHMASSVKTDAPPEVIFDFMRCWIKKHPINMRKIDPDSVCAKILAKEPETQANFSVPNSVIAKVKKRKIGTVSRWKGNPEREWGPKARAVGHDVRQTHPKKSKKSKN